MLVIRFLRRGKKNQPFFRIVVTDKKNPPRGGRFLEVVGFFNPLTKEKKLKKERIKYWLSVGAQPSDTVNNLLLEEKIIEGKKIDVHKKAKEKKKKPEEKPAEKPPVSAVASTGKEEKPEEKKEAPPEEEAKKQEEKPKQEKPPEEKPEEKTEEKVKEKTEEKPKEEEKPEKPSQPLDK